VDVGLSVVYGLGARLLILRIVQAERSVRGDRSRSTFESTFAKGPSANGTQNDVTITGTGVNKKSHETRRPFRDEVKMSIIKFPNRI
jgi:hypothetical protein